MSRYRDRSFRRSLWLWLGSYSAFRTPRHSGPRATHGGKWTSVQRGGGKGWGLGGGGSCRRRRCELVPMWTRRGRGKPRTLRCRKASTITFTQGHSQRALQWRPRSAHRNRSGPGHKAAVARRPTRRKSRVPLAAAGKAATGGGRAGGRGRGRERARGRKTSRFVCFDGGFTSPSTAGPASPRERLFRPRADIDINSMQSVSAGPRCHSGRRRRRCARGNEDRDPGGGSREVQRLNFEP